MHTKDQPLDAPGYALRVSQLEAEGMTTSDAQGCADAELLTGGLKLKREYEDCPNCDPCNPECDEEGKPYACYCCGDTGRVLK
jgi:hypothetical protein